MKYTLSLFCDSTKYFGNGKMTYFLTEICMTHQQTDKNVSFFMVAYWSEKAMAPHSSTLAWKIPWMQESAGLQSMGSLRVGHD